MRSSSLLQTIRRRARVHIPKARHVCLGDRRWKGVYVYSRNAARSHNRVALVDRNGLLKRPIVGMKRVGYTIHTFRKSTETDGQARLISVRPFLMSLNVRYKLPIYRKDITARRCISGPRRDPRPAFWTHTHRRGETLSSRSPGSAFLVLGASLVGPDKRRESGYMDALTPEALPSGLTSDQRLVGMKLFALAG